MVRMTWPPELRGLMFDALYNTLAGWRSNEIALVTRLDTDELKRLVEARIIVRESGSTLYGFHDGFISKAVALILDKWFPKEGKERDSEKASKTRDAYSLSLIKQAAKTMRSEMDDEGTEPTLVKELWPTLCLTDEGFFLIPYLAIYESGKARSDFTVEEREEYRVSLDGKED